MGIKMAISKRSKMAKTGSITVSNTLACKMGCLLVKWVVQVKWNGFGKFQSLFIIFLSFSMSNGPTQLQLYQVISAPTGPILVKLVSN